MCARINFHSFIHTFGFLFGGLFVRVVTVFQAMKENLDAVEGMLEQLKGSEKNLGTDPSEEDRLKLLLTSLQTRLARMREIYAEKHK